MVPTSTQPPPYIQLLPTHDLRTVQAFPDPANPLHRLRRALVQLLWEQGPDAPAGPYTLCGPKVGVELSARSPQEWALLPTKGKLLALCEEGLCLHTANNNIKLVCTGCG